MNTPIDSPRGRNRRHIVVATGLIGCILGAIPAARAGNDTWSGGGQDHFWTTPANWGGVAPNPGDSLFFVGTTHTLTTNNFSPATSFNNLTFNSPAGFFTLAGNSVSLTGNITNNQVVTPETISLPLVLTATPIVDVTSNGILTLNGALSGSGGLTAVDSGRVNLNGGNSFTGAVTVDAGTVGVSLDSNLGAIPGSATPGSIVLDGGTLEATANLTINTNRGIALGPTSGSGFGIISVNDHSLTPNQNTVLTYGGILANNGGTGGLTKIGFGNLTLFSSNTYTGTTSNMVGTLTLDFTHAGAPGTNIISPSSSLVLGGANAGAGQISFAQLTLKGAAVTNSQTFNGTHVTIGNQIFLTTNNTGGAMNVNLGALDHDAGGVLTFIAGTTNGNVTTTTANLNGILGGWAVFSDGTNRVNFYTVTNWACVGGSGNIVNYTNWAIYNNASVFMSTVMGAASNVYVPNLSSSFSVDANGLNATDDVNTIIFDTQSVNAGCLFGNGNTVRLGRFGGLLNKSILVGNNWHFGSDGSGSAQTTELSYLTAGGPVPNSPGEIVIINDTTGSGSGNNWDIDPVIRDNGTGPVTVIKAGGGYVKFRNHNTYSGGTYILAGRVQLAGGDIGTANPDAFGTGPLYIFPGAYIFGAFPNTPVINIAGIGTSQEPDGAIRLSAGNVVTNTIVLIGDAGIGGGNFASNPAILSNTISGPYNMYLGAEGNVGGGNNGIQLDGVCNWSGNTYIVSRTGTASSTTILLGENNALPTGFGKGDLYIGISTDTSGLQQFDLNGFNQTVNGLFSGGTTAATLAANLVLNGAASTTSTLTVGNNDVSATFGGVMTNGNGTLAFNKIGGGVQTLTGSNTYTGATTVNGGTLALVDPGSISTSTSIAVNSNATLDITGINAGFSTVNPVQLTTGGTMVGNGSVGALTMNNGALTLDLNPATTNVTASSLSLAGPTNLVNIDSVSGVSGYPTSFPVIKYSGALSGTLNFGIGAVPSPTTGGFVSNDVADSIIYLVLTNGPSTLTWTGTDPTFPTNWDTVTTNWISFKGSPQQAPAAFGTDDPVIFDDTGATNLIYITTNLQPAFITLSNNALNYTFTGVGSLNGNAKLVKFGTGSLTLLESGGDAYVKGVAVNQGTVIFAASNVITGGATVAGGAVVQVGQNTGTGNLPSGSINDNGTVTFDIGVTATNSSSFLGSGAITKIDNSILNFNANSGSFNGTITVQSGTLQAGNGAALGTNTTTVDSGATLDLNGQTLNTTAKVIASGTGIGGLGAIVNNGTANQNGLDSVTLTADTTIGGTNRWDIRGTVGGTTLSTGGGAYNLTKVGANYFAINNATVDGALNNINIGGGTLEYNGGTSGLGNSSGTLTVSNGATFAMFQATNLLNKLIVLNGVGTNDTLLAASGAGGGNVNNIIGNITVNGTNIWDMASGTAIGIQSIVSGPGEIVRTGGGTNTLSVSETYVGPTILSNGTWIVDATQTSPVTVYSGATLAGNSTISGAVTVFTNGTLSPGDPAVQAQATLSLGNGLTLNSNATTVFELASSPSFGNDEVVITGNLTVNGTNNLQIVPLSFMNVGDTYTLMTYTGSLVTNASTTAPNQFKIVPPANGFFSFALLDPSTNSGKIQIQVTKAVGNDYWIGNNSPAWDTGTLNWARNGSATPVTFINGDDVTFSDPPGPTGSAITNVNITSGFMTNSAFTESAFNEGYNIGSTGGQGGLAGTAGINLQGYYLLLTCSNIMTGGNAIVSPLSVLQLGNNTTNGSIGTGPITNSGTLVLDRSDLPFTNALLTNFTLANTYLTNTLVIPGVISGSGSISNGGSGVVTLTGANTYTGPTIIAAGTLSGVGLTAFGPSSGASITISNGATLNISNVVFGQKQVIVGGAGVGGNGAIVNNFNANPSATTNFQNILLTTNTVFGGNGRYDIRADFSSNADCTLSTGGMPYTLTKVGSNQFQIGGVIIDPALADIYVEGTNGDLGFQWQCVIGNPTNRLVISNSSFVQLFDVSNVLNKNLWMYNNGTLTNAAGSNEFDGPVTLAAGNGILSSGAGTLAMANEISGPGNLVKLGGGTVYLSLAQTNSGAEIYAGNTVVQQGTLVLLDSVVLTNSPVILVSNGAMLTVTGAVVNTLTLGSLLPQTLQGGGTIIGPLVENANSTVMGNGSTNPCTLILSNAPTLNGLVQLELYRTLSPSADNIISTNGFTVTGPLVVTNVGPDLQPSDHFQLFSRPVSGFSSITLPSTNSVGFAYQWLTNLAVDGSITMTNVISLSPTTNANITKAFLSGTNLVVIGTNNNVPNTSFHYAVLVSTNISRPLSLWTVVATNQPFVPGGTNFFYTNPVAPLSSGTNRVFIDIKAIP